jgi:tetratricopeptide (TPR) repeat protein
MQDLSRALQLNPDQFTVYYARAQSYTAINDFEKAAEDMEFLVRYFPDNEKFLYETGRIHYLNNSFLKALKHFNKLLEISADSAIYFQARGETYLATKIYKYAIMDFSMALDLDPVNSECYLKKGLARFQLGDTEGACIDWDKARRCGSEEAESLLTRHCK